MGPATIQVAGLFAHFVCTKLSDQWRNTIEVVLSKTEGNSGTLCDLDNARGDVEELPLMRNVESRHLATGTGTVPGIGKRDRAAARVCVCVCARRRRLESSDIMGVAKCKLWAGCMVEWLGKGLNERGHHRGWKGGSVHSPPRE